MPKGLRDGVCGCLAAASMNDAPASGAPTGTDKNPLTVSRLSLRAA